MGINHVAHRGGRPGRGARLLRTRLRLRAARPRPAHGLPRHGRPVHRDRGDRASRRRTASATSGSSWTTSTRPAVACGRPAPRSCPAAGSTSATPGATTCRWSSTPQIQFTKTAGRARRAWASSGLEKTPEARRSCAGRGWRGPGRGVRLDGGRGSGAGGDLADMEWGWSDEFPAAGVTTRPRAAAWLAPHWRCEAGSCGPRRLRGGLAATRDGQGQRRGRGHAPSDPAGSAVVSRGRRRGGA